MNVAVQAAVSGLTLGALYGLFALTVVVLWRTAGLVNFAQGSMATLSAFIAYFLLIPLGLPLWVMFLLSLLIGAVLGAVIYTVVLLPRSTGDHYNELFRTMGLSLFIVAFVQRSWGSGEPYPFPSLIGSGSVDVLGFRVQWLQLLTLVIALVLTFAFAAFLRTPRIGLTMRAVASDREVSTILGVRVRFVIMIAWLIVGAIGAAIALLFTPLYSLSSDLMEPFLLKGFAAALLGGLSSFRGAIVAGLIVGVMDAEVAVFLGPEWRDVASFILLLGVLLIRPSGIFGQANTVRV
ncbi:branched-chain amino acid transport system / permease component family protein [Pseudarthrobacter siccitolerans]|uniref:Branched-chain amino acid transport system / permease component family protein n=1 Tax=Pseudarthrobacter siccitolerans TaxID=861266 RepID=A0A024GX42_9MICC|nr:branched-chain amino acid ABC transporter permease [Pseudarthrobacter siccitolerans]CCQ44490.1 branched-chain amino acid transport system / permease component family protein [Pseudarthrobacter siccitolerans]